MRSHLSCSLWLHMTIIPHKPPRASEKNTRGNFSSLSSSPLCLHEKVKSAAWPSLTVPDCTLHKPNLLNVLFFFCNVLLNWICSYNLSMTSIRGKETGNNQLHGSGRLHLLRHKHFTSNNSTFYETIKHLGLTALCLLSFYPDLETLMQPSGLTNAISYCINMSSTVVLIFNPEG